MYKDLLEVYKIVGAFVQSFVGKCFQVSHDSKAYPRFQFAAIRYSLLQLLCTLFLMWINFNFVLLGFCSAAIRCSWSLANASGMLIFLFDICFY